MKNSHMLSTDQTLQLIENRTLHVLAKLRQAADILLDTTADATPPHEDAPDKPTLAAALELCAPHWAPLVPSAAEERHALAQMLAQRYPFDPQAVPALVDALGIDPETFSPNSGAEAGSVRAAQAEESSLSAAQKAVIDELEWVYCRRGDVLFQQGEEPDCLYILVDGLVRITRTPEGDGALMTMELGPGEIIGQMSLLLKQPHSTSAHAERDSDVCKLSTAALERLVQQHPAIMIKVAVQMANRVQNIITPAPKYDQTIVTLLVPAMRDSEASEFDAFAAALVADLAEHGPTLHLTAAEMNERVQQAVGADLEAFTDNYGFVDWLREQERTHKAVVYAASADYPNWTRRCVERANRILIVGEAGGSTAISPVEALIEQMPHPELLPPRELVLLHKSQAESPNDTRQWLAARNVLRHHHVALDTGVGVDRVSRFLRGKAIGLVLGGGGMRAASCYGVIQCLEEHGIRADVVGGTSAGSIAAALYALGLDAATIARVTREKLMKREILFDPTLPLASVMRAYRLSNAYTEVFGDVYMEDLWTTAFTISGNLTQAEMVVHKTGLLRHAVRASTSLAGIHPPALNEAGEMLIDGGIFNNTPADVARAMVETGPVIAVDLGFTKRKGFYHYGDSLNGFRTALNRINPFSETEPAPSIVSIMMRANALGSINATAQQVAHADLLLQPPVSDYGLFDLDAFDTVVAAGYEYAQERIAAWVAAGNMENV